MGRRRVTEEEIKIMKELREKGLSIGEIARIVGKPLSTVWYHLNPEARKKKREYKREYYQRPEVRERERLKRDFYLREILNFLEGNGNLNPNNVYVLIIRCVGKDELKKTLTDVWSCIEENKPEGLKITKSELWGKLEKLRHLGWIEVTKSSRYLLTPEGKKIYERLLEYLFNI